MPIQTLRLTWIPTFLHSVAFVLGFAFVFTLLGSAVGFIGQSLADVLPFVQKTGAILLVIFGLVTIGTVQWVLAKLMAEQETASNPAVKPIIKVLTFVNAMLYTERRVSDVHRVSRSLGFLSSFLMGVSFSAGWVPCVGPLLASILFIASDSATAASGAFLLLVFSMGLGLPFMVTGAAFGSITPVLRRLNRYLRIISVISGFFLFLVAYFLWTDRLIALTASFGGLNALALDLEDSVTEALGLSISLDANVVAGIPIAFLAGLIGFFSPCVLPLIPAYIGYLSGTSISAGTR
jgi:cytochrome c-type biogenesis protein